MGEMHGDESHGRICKKAPTKQTQSYQSYGQFNLKSCQPVEVGRLSHYLQIL